MVLNFYRYKTFVIFKSVTFEIYMKIMESVGDDANSGFYEDHIFFKINTILVTFKSVIFEIFRKCSESDTFEKYKSSESMLL